MKQKTVALYARVSTSDQSTTMQLTALRQFAEARGWTIAGEFVDEAISGATKKRPALDTLMDGARKRQFDAVAVWRFDRFARSTKHLLEALDEFRHLGIDFVSFSENMDTSSPLGEAIFTIVAAVAQLERDIIRERVKAGVARVRPTRQYWGRMPVEMQYPKIGLDVERLRKEGSLFMLSLRRWVCRQGRSGGSARSAKATA